jgi:type I restriction enzyme S subunit
MNNRAEAKTMKQGTRRELNPKRRFPEFRDAPNWIEKALDEALSPIARERKKPTDAYTGLGMRSHGKGTFLKNLENPEKNSMEYLYEVERDDLIVNITFAWEGAIAIAKSTDTGALVSHRFPTFVFKRDAAIPGFFRYIIRDKQFVYSLGVISPGGAGRNRVLNKNDFLKLRVFLPEVSEQEKIAQCLTSLDELIDAHGQKLDALKAHKRGLMQQLFPREDETLPRLRFPEFQNEPEWNGRTLISACQMQAGKFVSASDIQDEAGEGLYPCYGGNGLRVYTKTYTHSGKYPLIGRQGALCGNVKLGSGQFHATEHAVVATPKNGIDVDWLFYTLDFLNLNQYATGQAQPGLSVDVLEEVSLAIPDQESEQLIIARCLASLDGLITAQAQKLALLKTHKKGLMQQLFPSSEEVEA